MNSLEVNNLKEHGTINIIFKAILSSSKGQDSFFLKPFRGKKEIEQMSLSKATSWFSFKSAKEESHLIVTDTNFCLKK